MNEHKLVEKAKAGDNAAFEVLYDMYAQKVYNTALRMTRNAEDALDLAQEIFIRVYKSLPFFKGDSSFSTWLYSIASNACIDFTRRQAKRKTDPLEDAEFQLPDINTPESEYDKKKLREDIANAISALPPNLREVIVLREINGLSYAEIADALDIEAGTVKSRIARARERLCIILSEYGNKKKNSSSKDTKGGQI